MTINNIGIFRIEENVNGKKRKTLIKNKVMDILLQQQVEILQGSFTDLNIKYIAFGSDNTEPTSSDTQLGNEFFRKAFDSQSKTQFNELETIFKIDNSEGVGQIEEIGIFGGTSAGLSANSGTLISRVLWSKNKTSSENFDIIRIDRVERG